MHQTTAKIWQKSLEQLDDTSLEHVYANSMQISISLQKDGLLKIIGQANSWESKGAEYSFLTTNEGRKSIMI